MTLPTAAVVRATTIKQLGASTAEDANIDLLIARADKVLASWCGFPIPGVTPLPPGVIEPTLEITTYTHFFDGPAALHPRSILLEVRPVLTVTSVHDDSNRDWVYDASDLVAASEYTLDEREGRVWLHDDATHPGWSTAPRVLKVVYTAGYNTGASERITQGIATLVGHWWSALPLLGTESVTLTDTTIDAIATEIPAAVREIMWPIRLPEVGIG